MPHTVIQRLASTIQARLNCEDDNPEWFDKHTNTIEVMCHQHLPSGAGFDATTDVDYDKSNGERVVITTSFHKMDENGFYEGWSDFTITVRPAFTGISLKVSGNADRDLKEYVAEVFAEALRTEID